MEISELPEESIAHIISLTSPRDACRSSLVSPRFRSVADSDVVWEKFLPSDYKDLISRSVAAETTLSSMAKNKKALYLHLCENPIPIDDVRALEGIRPSGKKCFRIGARGLSIVDGDTPYYWRWTSLPQDRFSEVAELIVVCWLEIKGKIDTNILSPDTTYAAYFVFRLAEKRSWFNQVPFRFHVDFEQRENGKENEILLDPSMNGPPPLPQEKGDGWKEFEMGEFFSGQGENGSVLCSLKEVDDYYCKSGLIVGGIELRPKAGRKETFLQVFPLLECKYIIILY